MKNNITELVFILDKSGSMSGLEDDTIGGFNAMLEEQRRMEGCVYVSTVLFSNASEVIHDRLKIENVPKMTRRDYRVGGCTALLDSIGDAVHHIETIHKYARPEDVPEKTLFVITTDGMENASQKYTSDRVKSMIREKQETRGWEFIFLAANIDAVNTAATIGISPQRAADYTCSNDGIEKMYRSVNEAVRCMRTSGKMDADWAKELRKEKKK